MINNFAVKEIGMGLKIIESFYVEDKRGYFLKSFEKGIYQELGIENELSEVFESYSRKDVIRGLHFQTINPQIKKCKNKSHDERHLKLGLQFSF